MKTKAELIIWVAFLGLIQSVNGLNTSLDFNNQVSAWLGMNYTDQVFWQTGARDIPTLSPAWKVSNDKKLDAEFLINTYGNMLFSGSSFDTATYDLKAYRLWMRYSTSNLEIRAGLQKINFGSSNIFRPLMWFDRMDFRDPLQLTDGVYGLLGRYYFNNNANIWLWTLYGNKDVKGWEIAPSVTTIPEYGGRAQIPHAVSPAVT